MSNDKMQVFWTQTAKMDLKEIYMQLKQNYSKETALKIRQELYESPSNIVFNEQFQIDEYRIDCRRIVVRNYKILYRIVENSIFIVSIFNTFQNPLKSLK